MNWLGNGYKMWNVECGTKIIMSIDRLLFARKWAQTHMYSVHLSRNDITMAQNKINNKWLDIMGYG